MTNILREHWGQVFDQKSIDTELLGTWLNEVLPRRNDLLAERGLPSKRSTLWKIRRKDVEDAIKAPSKTMPGPDGIPYKAWQVLGPLGIDLLYEATKALGSDDGARMLQEAEIASDEKGHTFNLALLCCLPKKPIGIDPILGEFYSPASTRPLAIVNTDNRLIASAMRRRWESIFNKWVSSAQRGFLHGRSMLANVVDVDFDAMRISLTREYGALVLFDFQAAFPSVSHDYMRRVLRHLGLPEEARRLIDSLYVNTRCIISCQGGRYEGFPIRSGIRQGCPLSPLLFAVVADLVLRRLTGAFTEDTVRAFADDTAMVIQDWWRSAGKVRELFADFASISGLELNLPKTVVIPLWPEPLHSIRTVVSTELPEWNGVSIMDYGTYLGFAEGPGKGHHTWDKATRKYLDQAQLWGNQGTGLFCATAAYNTYVSTILAFVGQLENAPPHVLDAEKKALRRMAPGPGNWILRPDLEYLSECYGQSLSFYGVQTTAWSAQVRVTRMEAASSGGLRVHSRAKELRQLLNTAEYMGRRRVWQQWYDQSHVFVLESASRRFDSLDTTTFDFRHSCDATKKLGQKKGVSFQKSVRKHILKRNAPDAEERMRSKLARWHLPTLPRLAAGRALDNLTRLRLLVPPRVSAAVLGTMWNRWTTARRFQSCGRCTLGCSPTAADSIEHYSRCQVVQTIAAKYLGLRITGSSFLPLLTLTANELRAEPKASRLARAAVLAYATYRTTQTARVSGGLSMERASECMSQYIKEAVRGNARSTRLVEKWWYEETKWGNIPCGSLPTPTTS